MVVVVAELFSGIGGMRQAMAGAVVGPARDALPKEEGENGEEITNKPLSFSAFDTSDVVNAVYNHNSDSGALSGDSLTSQVTRVNIESLSADKLDKIGAWAWTMSPPCQPFTTTARAKQLDMKDGRNKGLAHLMKAIVAMKHKPQWIFFENVKGFVGSETHSKWTQALKDAGYGFRQFLLNPLQFRIPNNRMRFYMVCKLGGTSEQGFETDVTSIHSTITSCDCDQIKVLEVNKKQLDVSFNDTIDAPLHKLHELGANGISGPLGTNPIQSFLEEKVQPELFLSDELLKKKWAMGLSYVGCEDCCTFCFTSSYGATWHKSSGSLFHTDVKRGKLLHKVPDMSAENSGKARLFSPRELLRLFAFPDNFTYPEGTPLQQQFRVVGQSVNVAVVRALVHAELCRFVALSQPKDQPSKRPKLA